MNAVSFSNCSFKYANGEHRALRNINLDIKQGKITVLCGRSGSGKSTLLRLMKDEASPVGTLSGKIDSIVPSNRVAMIFQNPDSQLVCTKVIHDLVFHMENLGFEPTLMKKRLAETCSFFGIESLLHKSPDELSGGQKQLVALCSALMVLPKLLLLDEPLSQLDPIATIEFLDMLKRINAEFGITIVICEHRITELISIADNIVILHNGGLSFSGNTSTIMRKIWQSDNDDFLPFIPDVTKTSLKLFDTVLFKPSELAHMLGEIDYKYKPVNLPDCKPAVVIKELVFSYKGSNNYVLRRLSTEIEEGKITCLLGGNGSGKSTLLKLIVGINRGYIGSIKVNSKKVAFMPQNVWTFFKADTCREEIIFDGYDDAYYSYVCEQLEITQLENRHPFDLSGGESIRVCLASILLRKPDIIVLDEPTRGLDSQIKETLILLLKSTGCTVIMSSHDLEFAAQFADRCIMLFDGEATYNDDAHRFFMENRYYTTSLSKAFRHTAKDIVTYKDVEAL